MESPDKKLLYNPLAAEFGIGNMAEMNSFIRNEMTRFKMVSCARGRGQQRTHDWVHIRVLGCDYGYTRY